MKPNFIHIFVNANSNKIKKIVKIYFGAKFDTYIKI